MRPYEILFIVHPDLDENAFNDIVNRVTSWITEENGEITKTELWGKKTLAYPIRKQTEGQYVLINANIPPSFCVQLERNFRYLEHVMRFMIISLEQS